MNFSTKGLSMKDREKEEPDAGQNTWNKTCHGICIRHKDRRQSIIHGEDFQTNPIRLSNDDQRFVKR